MLPHVPPPHAVAAAAAAAAAVGQLPHFMGNTVDDYIRDTVSIEKDVEGLCFTYRNNLYRNVRFVDREESKKCIVPCTRTCVCVHA